MRTQGHDSTRPSCVDCADQEGARTKPGIKTKTIAVSIDDLPPELVPCGGVRAPNSVFRLLKTVFLPTSSRAAACEGVRAPKNDFRFPKNFLYLFVSLSLALSIFFSLSFSLSPYVFQSVYIPPVSWNLAALMTEFRSHDGIWVVFSLFLSFSPCLSVCVYIPPVS